ncbi:MAG: hypothetical protein M3547_09270 [Acidobacteriota bacterium]|nr:hypothetical protein [Acidobacteriota bacterium]
MRREVHLEIRAVVLGVEVDAAGNRKTVGLQTFTDSRILPNIDEFRGDPRSLIREGVRAISVSGELIDAVAKWFEENPKEGVRP